MFITTKMIKKWVKKLNLNQNECVCVCLCVFVCVWVTVCEWFWTRWQVIQDIVCAGNTKGESVTVLLDSCLTGFD